MELVDDTRLMVVQLRPTGEVTKQERNRIWGYHLDGRNYVLYEKRFYEITVNRMGHPVTLLPYDAAGDEAAIAAGMIVGGIFGAALTNAAIGTTVPNMGEFELDLKTGNFMLRRKVFSIRAQPTGDAPIYLVNLSEGKWAEQPAVVFAPDAPTELLPAGAYLAYDQDVLLELGTQARPASRQRQLVVDTEYSKANVYILRLRKTQVFFERADRTERHAILDRIVLGELVPAAEVE